MFAKSKENIDSCLRYEQIIPHINIIEINLRCKSVKIIVDLDTQNRKTTSQFAINNNLVAAINGDYPRFGLHMNDGKILSHSFDRADRNFLGCDQENKCFVTKNNSIDLPEPGLEVAIGGWQSLSSGRFSCSTKTEKRCTDKYAKQKHPRTAIGLDKIKGKLYFIVVEGRLPEFPGMTLDELSDLFKKLEIPEGLNLDGGGSSTMIYKGARVNRLPLYQYSERPVISHIGVAIENEALAQ